MCIRDRVHLASWRRRPDEGNRWFNWDEFADELVPYVQDICLLYTSDAADEDLV